MTPLNLPSNYNWVDPGTESIRYECPWMVPEAVLFMNQRLKKSWRVLEVGSGGSSFFFARRCGKVLAIENFHPYYEKMHQSVLEKNISDSLELRFVPTEQLAEALSGLSGSYDVISIDHGVHHPSRSECLERVLRLWTGEMLVMDNWAKKPAWPHSWKASDMQLKQIYPMIGSCVIEDFVHPKWAGRGTRIVYKK